MKLKILNMLHSFHDQFFLLTYKTITWIFGLTHIAINLLN